MTLRRTPGKSDAVSLPRTENRSTHPAVSRRHFLVAGTASLIGGSTLAHPAHAQATSSASSALHFEAPAWSSHNPFLSGPFEPVFDERDDTGLRIDGTLPAGLDGAFIRNGPNPEFEPDARYRNRWVLTEELARERAAGHRLYGSFASDGPYANLSNTNIVHHAGRLLSLYEGGLPYQMGRDLTTRGRFDFGGMLPGRLSAHPKVDPVSGELLSVSYDLNPSARMMRLYFIRADARGRLDRMVPFDAPWPAMVHDVALSENYLIAVLCPLVFGASDQAPAAWQPERGTRIAVIPRNAGSNRDVRWIEGPAFFNWHFINAHEIPADPGAGGHAGGRIVLTLPRYNQFTFDRSPRTLSLYRLTLDLQAGTASETPLDDQVCEFGRINERYLGRPARYGYVGLYEPRPGEPHVIGTFNAIARYDLGTGEKVVHRFARGTTVCEPVFAPNPGGTDEDDGYILTYTQDAGQPGSRFLVLDAQQLDAEPIATVHLPRRVPAGLHGSWVAA